MKPEFGNPKHIAMIKKKGTGKCWADIVGRYPGMEHCKDCKFCQGWVHHDKTYYKCEKHPVTNGPGTDIRLKDHACILFEKDVK